MKKTVVVFGGFGFLGKHIVALLEKNDKYDVISLSRRNGCDMRSFQSVFEHLDKIQPKYIINCAAHVGSVHYAMEFAGDLINDNTLIVANLYRAVAYSCPNATIINPLSNCSYPGNADIQIEKDWSNGAVHDSVLSYGITRRLIYALAESYYKQYKIKSVNWLISNAYGPGDYLDPYKVHALNGIIIRMLKAKKDKKKTFEIWGSGNPTREWVYINDVAKILVHSLNIKKQIYPINFAQNKAYSINDITSIVAKALNYDVKFEHKLDLPDGAPTKILDDKQFRKKYPEFKFTSLEKGIKNTIKFYEESL